MASVKGKKKTVWGVLGDLLFLVVLGFVLSYPICGAIDRVTNYSCPWFGLRNAIVRTGSMGTANPANTYLDDSMERIYPNDLVTTKNYGSYEEIHLYDVLTYVAPEGLICHRVVALYESEGTKWIVTRGDANTMDDAPFRYEQVRGKVIGVARGLGPFVDFFGSPYFLIALCGSGFFIFLGMYIYDLNKNPTPKAPKDKDKGRKDKESPKKLVWLPPKKPKDPSI